MDAGQNLSQLCTSEYPRILEVACVHDSPCCIHKHVLGQHPRPTTLSLASSCVQRTVPVLLTPSGHLVAAAVVSRDRAPESASQGTAAGVTWRSKQQHGVAK